MSQRLNYGLELLTSSEKKTPEKSKKKRRLHSAAVPDYCVCADNKFRPRVPLVIGYVVVRLKPNPLLTFGQETVVARLPFAVLHH